MSNAAEAASREVPGVVKAKRTALVVEADYFAMTSRVDSNVIFWEPGFDVEGVPKIPKCVTHLWMHRSINAKARKELETQAQQRGIQIWKCQIFELRHRLLDFWTPENRSLINPVLPEEDAGKALEASVGELGQVAEVSSLATVGAASKY